MTQSETPNDNRPNVDQREPSFFSKPPSFLWAGVLLGFLAAVSGLLEDKPGLGDETIAVVNGAELLRSDYNKHLRALRENNKTQPSEEDGAYILRRMIEEELLLQRAVETGILRRNKSVRGNITRAMIDSIIAESKAEPVDDAELKDFFADNKERFTQTGRLRLGVVLLQAESKTEAEEEAKVIKAAWQTGQSITSIRKDFGAEEGQPLLPDTLLPPAKIRDYIGPGLTQAGLLTPPGGMSEPVVSNEKFYLIFHLESKKIPPASFAAVRDQVEFEFRRIRSDKTLREYLDWLYKRADLEHSEDFL